MTLTAKLWRPQLLIPKDLLTMKKKAQDTFCSKTKRLRLQRLTSHSPEFSVSSKLGTRASLKWLIKLVNLFSVKLMRAWTLASTGGSSAQALELLIFSRMRRWKTKCGSFQRPSGRRISEETVTFHCPASLRWVMSRILFCFLCPLQWGVKPKLKGSDLTRVVSVTILRVMSLLTIFWLNCEIHRVSSTELHRFKNVQTNETLEEIWQVSVSG